MDLEQPSAPDAPPAPAAATPPAPAEPPAPPPDPVEASAVDVQGGKFVPLEALKAEREKGKSFREKADQYDQVIGYVNQVRPYIDFLQKNPQFMTRTAEATAPAPTTTTQPVDEAAESLARTLDLYTPDGKPDVQRAQKIRTLVSETARAEADAKIKPIAESTTRERSAYNYQRALATKGADGRTADRAILDALWARTDPSVTASEEGATALVALAIGMGAFSGQGHAPVPAAGTQPPPVVTERSGGRGPNTTPMGDLEQTVASMRGVKQEDWQKLTRGYNQGRPNVLEE